MLLSDSRGVSPVCGGAACYWAFCFRLASNQLLSSTELNGEQIQAVSLKSRKKSKPEKMVLGSQKCRFCLVSKIKNDFMCGFRGFPSSQTLQLSSCCCSQCDDQQNVFLQPQRDTKFYSLAELMLKCPSSLISKSKTKRELKLMLVLRWDTFHDITLLLWKLKVLKLSRVSKRKWQINSYWSVTEKPEGLLEVLLLNCFWGDSCHFKQPAAAVIKSQLIASSFSFCCWETFSRSLMLGRDLNLGVVVRPPPSSMWLTAHRFASWL